MNLIKNESSLEYDNLKAGTEIPYLTTQINLTAGQGILKRGSVIGIDTISQTGILCSKAATDGSQNAKYILAEDVDTTDVLKASCYKTGMFHRGALIFGEPSTASDHEQELRILGIYLREEY